MTRDAFIRQWRSAAVMIGMDALRTLTGPSELKQYKAEALLNLPTQIDGLLGRMFDSLQPKPEPAANGAAPVKQSRPT